MADASAIAHSLAHNAYVSCLACRRPQHLHSIQAPTLPPSAHVAYMPKALDVIHKLAVSGLVTATLFGIYTCVDGTRHIVDARKKEAARMKAAGEAPKPPPKHEKYFS